MFTEKRRYNLMIWALGLGYFLSYTPYSGLTKALSSGLLPGTNGPVLGPVLLPLSAVGTVVGMFGFITVMGWWKYAGRREFFGVRVPFPRKLTFLSGICMATIMGTTTLAFTFGGLGIVLVLVLLRAGTLIIAPVVDRIVGRRVRWFSWSAMLVSLAAVLIALSDAASYTLTIAAALDIAAYLAAYFFKLQFMSRLAKTDDPGATRRYLVEEQMVASPLLLIALVTMAFIGAGDVMLGFRAGLTTFLMSEAAIYALLVGLCYAALCVCTTLIFLDRRENTFCMPMHSGSSMLAGFAATAILAVLYNQNAPTVAQTVSAGFIFIALGFLSPLHHLDRLFARLRGARRERLFLFVCSGNTCRSPMAAAIANAEIAARLRVPLDKLQTVNARALSAGVSARVGEPLTAEAQEALSLLDVPVQAHAARNLTPEMAQQAERIFCMTNAVREAVIQMLPAAANKTYCLDAASDIPDPIGKGMDAYLTCARRIHDLVRLRFDELDLKAA
jgi:protein-tyrosine-phosphatase